MAIARGAGTEIIRTAFIHEVDDSARYLIYGAQHHIYTILSITCHAVGVNSAASYIEARFVGYDAGAGTSAADIYLFRQGMAAKETFVWNDKFSFNGYEPTDFTGPINSVVKQDAIADQASGVAQYLLIGALHSADNFDCTITYIDQNNA
jgi:hypothetical protein